MIKRNFISIIGGAGHVGAPLGLALSSKGFNVILIDKNKENTKKKTVCYVSGNLVDNFICLQKKLMNL